MNSVFEWKLRQTPENGKVCFPRGGKTDLDFSCASKAERGSSELLTSGSLFPAAHFIVSMVGSALHMT